MRKVIFATIMLAGLWMTAACDKEEVNGDVPEAVARPTDWVVSQDLNPTTEQAVVVKSEGLPTEIDKNDLLAAFVNGDCTDVSAPILDDDGAYFALVVMAPGAAEGNHQVELRYYSAKAQRIYYADPFVLCPGERLGSLTGSGYAPRWR